MAIPQYYLNRLLGIEKSNFEVVDIKIKDNEITWVLKHKPNAAFICSRCGGAVTKAHSKSVITLLDVPLGLQRQKLLVERAKILCPCSYRIRNEKIPFRSEYHRITQRFVDYIEMILCTKMMTVADVARLFNLDYGIVYQIDHHVLRRLIENQEIPDPINISVDEKAWKKGHHYLTLVTDRDIGKVIWVSEGRGKESLDEFFKVLGTERCRRIKTVAKDMHKPYAESCAEFIPQAVEVADSFHVVKHLNDTIDKCRRYLIESNETTKSKKKKLKSQMWVIRHKKENMSERTFAEFAKLEKINQPLFRAYLHKEIFYDFFEFKPLEISKAKEFLESWIKQAYTLGFNAMNDFAEFLERHFDSILNIIREQKNSAISEGINRKINVIIGMAYGYKCIEYLKLKILQRCGVLGKLWRPISGKVIIT